MSSTRPTSHALRGRPITSIAPDEEMLDWRRLLIILAGILFCLFIFLVIIQPAFSAMPGEDLGTNNPGRHDRDQSTKNPYYFFYQHFIGPDSRLTDLQQERAWSKYEGRWINWTGIIADVYLVFGSPVVTIDMGMGSFLPEVSFKLADVALAQSLRKNSRIFFTGRLTRRPGKIFSLSLQEADIISNASLADFYPLYYVSRRPAYIFATPEDYGEISQRLVNMRSATRVISKMERHGCFSELPGDRLIILRGNMSGKLSQVQIVGMPGTYWIMNETLRKEGIPVKDVIQVADQ